MNSINNSNLPPIVIENGSFFTRCGFVGEDNPNNIYRTNLLHSKTQFTQNFQKLYINPSSYYVVILKDTGTSNEEISEEADILFNDFNIKACAFGNSQTAILSNWAHGYNGLIIDIGYKNSICAPIINGKPRMDLFENLIIAGKTIENHILEDLKAENDSISNDVIQRNREQILSYLKKKHYYFECQKGDFEYQDIKKRKLKKFFELNDEIVGKIDINLPEPILPEDLLLKNQDANSISLTDLVIKVVNNCLLDIGAKKLERIIFCGGGSQVLGLRSFLIHQILKSTDLQKSIEKYEVGIKNVPPKESIISSWLGGSILFSSSYSKKFFISKQNYTNKNRTINFIDEELAAGIKNHKI
uniref:Putative actin-related protein n=1 Tax=uncultured organism TaxID=155900 RepID=A0A0F6PZY4_9ZZZZ|nr:putative actin-related protein [uncultured organism]